MKVKITLYDKHGKKAKLTEEEKSNVKQAEEIILESIRKKAI